MNYYELSDIEPDVVLSSFGEDEYERAVKYWIQGYLNKNEKYNEIKPHPKGKDKGRDISAYYDESRKIWDNYQCKHYKDPLSPKTLREEIGKLCFHTYSMNLPTPKNYYFVSPKGLSDDSNDLIYYKQDALRQSILDNWDNDCKIKKDGKKIQLTEELKKYIQTFDFTIFKEVTPTSFYDFLHILFGLHHIL